MRYTEIIGEHLKSDFLCDLFETYDVEVIYEYDRTHENLKDEYHAEVEKLGLEFLFNKEQKVIALFMENSDHDGFNPFEPPDPRIVSFESRKGAENYANENNIKYESHKEKKDSFFGVIPDWVKFYFNEYSIHYEFNKNGIAKVTIQYESA